MSRQPQLDIYTTCTTVQSLNALLTSSVMIPIVFPSRHRCDTHCDCPYGEDENTCSDFKCYGLFFCPVEQRCLSFLDVCDGKLHCKETEIDEHYCDVRSCSKDCFCIGHAIQ